jgi:hypothetical protein
VRRLKTTAIIQTPEDPKKRQTEASRIKPHSPFSPCRRKFLGDLGGTTAATIVTGAIGLPAVSLEARTVPKDESLIAASGSARAEQASKLRVQAALFQKLLPLPEHPDNGDEERYQNRIGNYSKGLPHNRFGEVDPVAYDSLLQALNSLGHQNLPNRYDTTQRYIRDGRDLGERVHIDVLSQADFNATLILLEMGAPPDSNNPNLGYRNQDPFGTFGPPHVYSSVCVVAASALRAAWHQKWYLHLTGFDGTRISI